MGDMRESEVTAAIVRFLRRRGWNAKRQNVARVQLEDGRRIAFGKRAQADWAFDHPQFGLLEVEMKAPGKKPTKAQAEYLATAVAVRKIKATWTDDPAKFERWYAENYPTV